MTVLYGEDGILLESNFDNSGKQIAELRNKSSYFDPGLCWAHRTSRFQPSIVPKGSIFTTGRYLAVFETNEDILWVASFWNSDFLDYTLKLSMERVGDPKFINGVVNQLPHPNLPQALQEQLAAETVQQHSWIERVFQREETSLYYRGPALQHGESLLASIAAYRAELAALKKQHLASLGRINSWVYDHFGITAAEQTRIRDILDIANARPEGTVFNISERALAEGVFSWLLGVVFGRWDVRLSQRHDLLPRKEDLFSALPSYSPATLVGPDALAAHQAIDIASEAWLESHDTIESRAELGEKPVPANTAASSTPENYPVAVLWDGLGTHDAQLSNLDLMSHLRAVLRLLWPANADRTERELADLLGVETLDDYLSAPSGFFARHLAQYTQNKRAAPIYWPVTSPGGRLTVWVYYPRLTNQTLYRIVNEVVQPHLQLTEADLLPLAANPNLDAAGRHRLADLRETAADLRDFETELLRVARHYQPNHDDGVLLTAAPLHRLFRAAKWRKLTEDAWFKLEAGDYDWAHLALTLWPARVREKCRTDLSLAIAHGLEHLCEVKPKEKTTRKKASIPNEKNGQMTLEE